MEVKVPKERIEEIMKRIRERALNQFVSGNVVDLVVIDAIDKRNSLIIAAFDNGWNLSAYNLSKYGSPRVLESIISSLESLKCCVIKCRVIGTRILAVAYVEEFQGSIPQELVKVGVIRRTATGTRAWIETDEERYLVSDNSIKGALLTAKAKDGDIIVFTGYTRNWRDINVINFIHWLRVENSVDGGT